MTDAQMIYLTGAIVSALFAIGMLYSHPDDPYDVPQDEAAVIAIVVMVACMAAALPA